MHRHAVQRVQVRVSHAGNGVSPVSEHILFHSNIKGTDSPSPLTKATCPALNEQPMNEIHGLVHRPAYQKREWPSRPPEVWPLVSVGAFTDTRSVFTSYDLRC